MPTDLYIIPSNYFTSQRHGAALVLHDKQISPNADLEFYYNDLYKIFLHRLSSAEQQPSISVQEETRLTAMLAELFKVKRILNGSLEV